MEYTRIYHKLEIINNKKQFVVYADYPYEFEFGLDFNSRKNKISDLSKGIKEYVSKNLSSFKDATIMLVLNGVIIGTFAISQIVGPNISSSKLPETEIVAMVGDEEQNIVGEAATSQNTLVKNVENNDNKNEDEKNKEVREDKKDEKVEDSNLTKATTAVATLSSAGGAEVQTISNKKTNNNTSNNTKAANTTNTSSNNSKSANNTQNTNQGRNINLRLNNGSVVSIALEDYVIGVVGSEMPALFNSEALKAQAVCARTFALKKSSTGATLTATTADQVYKTNDELKAMWGSSYNTYYNKVKNAVLATSGEVMTYGGSYIDAVYFSTSNGRTEDAVYVWNYSVPYLKSVESKWDVGTKFFDATKTFSKEELSSKLGVNVTSVSDIVINSKTTGDRVNRVVIAGKEFTGVKIRTILGLRSADFTVTESGNNITFKTKGWGHGVGMSQYGANGMANAGYNYSQILKHYYSGITITKK